MKLLLQNKKYILSLLLVFFMGVGTVWADDSDPIVFADDNVKAICVANWDTNGDGELSYAEAAVVTSLETVFQNNTTIERFRELEYFINLISIDDYAFSGCTNLQRIAIPSSVTYIGSGAFSNCTALARVYYGSSLDQWCGIYFAYLNSNPLYYAHNLYVKSGDSYSKVTTFSFSDNVTSIGSWAFAGCTSITGNLIIPNSVTSIGRGAFMGCTGLTGSLIIPNSVTIFGDHINGEYYNTYGAFNGCTGFTGDLVIPNSVTNIGNGTFQGCTGFTGNLIIPNPATFIGKSAFEGCTGFSGSLTLGNSLTEIQQNAFKGCTGFSGDLVIPNSVTKIGKSAFEGCTGFSGSLILGNSLTEVQQYAFNGCKGFTGDLVIPNSMTEIGPDAFYGCSGGSLTIGNSVTIVGSAAFYNGDFHGGSLTIGNSVTEIGSSAFCYSGFGGDLVIPNSVTKIGDAAFWQNGYSSFSSALVLGNSLTRIGNSAFGGFKYIISKASTPPSIYEEKDNDFIKKTSKVYVPYGSLTQYKNKNGWSYFSDEVYETDYRFVFDELDDISWSNEDNWIPEKPTTNNVVVCVSTNCRLDTDAEVLYLYVRDDEDVITVDCGKTLTSSHGVDTQSPSQLIIEDGGQLIANKPVQGTVQKHIDAFTSNNDGWNFIASPVMTDLTVSGLIPTGATVYDLYYLDEENTMWRNYKQNAFELNHGQGYLYANGVGSTINFSGNLQPYVEAGVPITLSNEGDGWNLVGNPFTFNAYANKHYYVINGRTVEAATSGAIAPCTGIVVKATGDNQTVAFTKNNPAALVPNHGNLNIVVAEQLSTRGGASSSTMLDKAIVSFNAEDALEKFYFGESKAVAYIPQGHGEFAIASCDAQGEIPVNFKARENGNYSITVNPEDVELNYLHLIDNLTGTDINLLETPSYTFTAKNNDYASRFRLVFSAQPNGEENENEDFAFISNGNIIVNGTGTLQILDVNGRMVSCNSVGDNISTNGLSAGVYMLRLVNPDKVKVQKIVIK